MSSELTNLISCWLNDMGDTPCKRDHHRQVCGGSRQGAILVVGNAMSSEAGLQIIVGCSTIQIIIQIVAFIVVVNVAVAAAGVVTVHVHSRGLFPPSLVDMVVSQNGGLLL